MEPAVRCAAPWPRTLEWLLLGLHSTMQQGAEPCIQQKQPIRAAAMVLAQDATSSSSPHAPLAGATGPPRARRPRRYGMIGRRRATKAARGIGATGKGSVRQGKQQQQQQAVGSRQSTCIDSVYAAAASRRLGARLGPGAATADQSAGGEVSAVLAGPEAATTLPNPFVRAVDSPWSMTLSHAEAEGVRESMGLAPASQQQLSVPTAAAQVRPVAADVCCLNHCHLIRKFPWTEALQSCSSESDAVAHRHIKCMSSDCWWW